MLQRVVLPIDGTERFLETMRYLGELADRPGVEVRLLHVATSAGDDDAVDPADHPLLERYVSALANAGVAVGAEVCRGDPVGEITRVAAQRRASLILMSTHGRAGLENVREGSVTEQVVRHSPCPVFIMHSTRPDHDETRPGPLFRRMLVPLDGTEISAAILPCVRDFATHYHAEVVLFHDHPECGDGAEAEASRRREFLGHHGVELANAGVSVQLDCSTHRRPVHEILRRIDELDVDVVAMVTHGTAGERRPLEESVTANVMRHASRPLLVWSSDPQCAVH